MEVWNPKENRSQLEANKETTTTTTKVNLHKVDKLIFKKEQFFISI